MPLKIEPHAIEQEKGDFTFPGLIVLDGNDELTLDYWSASGTHIIRGRNTATTFPEPIQIFGSVIQFAANNEVPVLRLEQGKFGINPTAADVDLDYLDDTGNPLIFGDAGLSKVIFGSNRSLAGKIAIVTEGVDEYPAISLETYHDTAYTPRMYTRVARGTYDNPAAITTNYSLYSQTMYGHDGNTWRIGASFTFYPDVNWSSGSYPTNYAMNLASPVFGSNPRVLRFDWGTPAWEFNQSGHDIDFIVYATGSSGGDANNPALAVEGSSGYVGLGTITPSERLSLIDAESIGLGQYPTGTASAPLEPSVGRMRLFTQNQRQTGNLAMARTYGSGVFGDSQPITERGPEAFKITAWHLHDPAYYIISQRNVTTLTTGAPAINTVWAMPFWCFHEYVVDTINVYVTVAGGAGSAIRLGVYDNRVDSDFRPDRLVQGSGSISTTSTGIKTFTPTNLQLEPGMLYWFVFFCGTSAPTINTLPPGAVFPIFAYSTIGNANVGVGCYDSQAFGALPTSFSFTGVLAGNSVPIPAIYVEFGT